MNDTIIYGVTYHQYNHGNNPLFDTNSRRVMDLKDGYPAGVKFATDYFKRIIEKCRYFDVFCTVPSNKETFTSVNTNITSIVISRLAKEYHKQDGTQFLRRTKTIMKLSNNGNRNLKTHLESIVNLGDVKGKNVVLFDDVYTTGNSLLACKDILYKAGAKRVVMFAVAKTNGSQITGINIDKI